jgi:uncharacterized protein
VSSARFGGAASPLYAKGLEEFRAGRFFEAHEEWELLWKESVGDDKLFLQGLIQLAAGCVHVGRGNPAPGKRLFVLAREKLVRFGDRWADLPLGLLDSAMSDLIELDPAALLRVDLRARFRI